MDERRHNRTEPWDDGIYETGRTRPPKRHGGFLALFFVTVIFLSGIICALSVLNIRLLDELSGEPEEASISMSFSGSNSPVSSVSDTTAPTETQENYHAPQKSGVSLALNQSPQSLENVPQEGGLSLQEIYDAVIPSVVSITCTTQSGTASGTGVIFSEDGYIVTNCHVVEGASVISVLLTDERTFSASVVGSDSVSDLAILYIDAKDLTAAEFGDSGSLRVGDAVVAIGDPLGVELRGTMTNGIISAINRDITVKGRTMTLIQTNAALNSGNSGGPLINCYGQVVGINTLKIGNFVDSAGVEGIGFAIPSSTVKVIVDQLIDQGYVSGRPTLGIKGESVSIFYQRYYLMPAGIFITELDPTSDAARKGIQTDDILMRINDTYITSMDDLNTVLYGCEVGDTVRVIIYRSGKQYSVDLTLSESKG